MKRVHDLQAGDLSASYVPMDTVPMGGLGAAEGGSFDVEALVVSALQPRVLGLSFLHIQKGSGAQTWSGHSFDIVSCHVPSLASYFQV